MHTLSSVNEKEDESQKNKKISLAKLISKIRKLNECDDAN